MDEAQGREKNEIESRKVETGRSSEFDVGSHVIGIFRRGRDSRLESANVAALSSSRNFGSD
jgi:hypothetical protein